MSYCSDLPGPAPVTLSPFIPEHGFALTSLEIVTGHVVIPLLRHLPHLRVLKAGSMTNEILEALPTHCRHLEIIQLTDCNYSVHLPSKRTHDELHRFLLSCPTIKVIDGIGRYVNADDMIEEPWACQGLEKLRFGIFGVKRLTKDEWTIYDAILAAHPKYQDGDDLTGIISTLTDQEQAVVQKLLQSREQQQQVYERLANLQNLKHLDFGYKFNNHGRDGANERESQGSVAYDTLELSLGSGLEQLGALKNLRVIGFESRDHRIGTRELEWMATNWPRLRLMHGLVKNELRCYMRTLRPDVAHDISASKYRGGRA
ncbi:hypothetical protein B0O80DRAFT_434393, partial [Mortierella sp. GBAus27b]